MKKFFAYNDEYNNEINRLISKSNQNNLMIEKILKILSQLTFFLKIINFNRLIF